MSERTDVQFLQYILESANAIMEFVAGFDLQLYSGDRKTKSLTIKELESIGEVANRISTAKKEKYPDVPWRLMKNFRCVLSNEYFGVNDELVWDIVQRKIPELSYQIRAIIRIESSVNGRVL